MLTMDCLLKSYLYPVLGSFHIASLFPHHLCEVGRLMKIRSSQRRASDVIKVTQMPTPAVSIFLGTPSVVALLTQCLCPLTVSLQVRGSCEWQPGGGHPGLAISLGHCHRLFLLHLWGWTTEPHRGPTPAAGHLSGWHSALPAGQCGRATPHNRSVIWVPAQETLHQGFGQP